MIHIQHFKVEPMSPTASPKAWPTWLKQNLIFNAHATFRSRLLTSSGLLGYLAGGQRRVKTSCLFLT